MQEFVGYINETVIFLAFAASLNLLVGYLGIFSAAQAAFGGVSAYAFVYLVIHGMNPVPAAVLAVALAASLGGLIALPVLRLGMLWVMLLTLTFSFVLTGVALGTTALGGELGLQLLPGQISLFGRQIFQPTDVLPLVVVVVALVFGICWRLAVSPYGRLLRAIREDDRAAQTLGKNIFGYKWIVFTLTASMAGVAGVLLSVDQQAVSPYGFGFDTAVQIFAIVIIGGMGNLVGTIIGTVLVIALEPLFQNVLSLQPGTAALAKLTAYGFTLLLVVYLRPQGILPEGTKLWASIRGVGSGSERPAVQSDELRAKDAKGDGIHVLPARDSEGADGGFRPNPDDDYILEAHDLAKSFAGIRAVDGLSLALPRGTITALVGPNGAGKTTVFNLLTGALPLDRGEVVYQGQDITGWRPDQVARLGIGRSFQDVRVFKALTVLENVMVGLQQQPGEHIVPLFSKPSLVRSGDEQARDVALSWLGFVGMERLAQVRAASLGYGDQKLVALARILATNADLLLLDEPASGIDHHSLDELLELIKLVRDSGRTVCIVEHNLEVVESLADRVCFMELGRVTSEGSFADLTTDARLAEAYFGTV